MDPEGDHRWPGSSSIASEASCMNLFSVAFCCSSIVPFQVWNLSSFAGVRWMSTKPIITAAIESDKGKSHHFTIRLVVQ